MFFTKEQDEIIEQVVEYKKNVFYSGQAGTGKSVLLREIISRLNPNDVAVTASTGIAACNINGCTLHSFAGIRTGDQIVTDLIKAMNKQAVYRWRKTKILIIDEISMIDGRLFDKIEEIARTIRQNNRPFGGIQLLICGDFLQLPPVGEDTIFAFEAVSWNSCIDRTFILTNVFRQTEKEFLTALSEIRMGEPSRKTNELFENLDRDQDTEDGIIPTQLFPLRSQADVVNDEFVGKLSGEEKTYIAKDYCTFESYAKKLDKDCIAPKTIRLKIGAQVIFLLNKPDLKLVNGTVGKVIRFSKSTKLPVVKFSNGVIHQVSENTWEIKSGKKVVATRTQLPLILAYALTIHKSQGQTLKYVSVDLSKVFEHGQVYVALSRATSLDGLKVIGYDPMKIKANQTVLDYYIHHL